MRHFFAITLVQYIFLVQNNVEQFFIFSNIVEKTKDYSIDLVTQRGIKTHPFIFKSSGIALKLSVNG
jgi:hypothetical protein